MGKIEKGSVAYLFIEMISISIAGIILWPLLDYLYQTFITHSPFVYSAFEHIAEPIIFGCIMGLVFWFFDRKKAKSNT